MLPLRRYWRTGFGKGGTLNNKALLDIAGWLDLCCNRQGRLPRPPGRDERGNKVREATRQRE